VREGGRDEGGREGGREGGSEGGTRQLNTAGCGDEERGASGSNWQKTATLCHKLFMS